MFTGQQAATNLDSKRRPYPYSHANLGLRESTLNDGSNRPCQTPPHLPQDLTALCQVQPLLVPYATYTDKRRACKRSRLSFCAKTKTESSTSASWCAGCPRLACPLPRTATRLNPRSEERFPPRLPSLGLFHIATTTITTIRAWPSHRRRLPCCIHAPAAAITSFEDKL